MKKLVLVASFLAAVGCVSVLAADRPAHTVDYVIGMLEAGVDPATIVARIHEGHLTFRVGEGDLDRLRGAGATDELVRAVTGEDAAPATPRGPSTRRGAAPPETAPPSTGQGTASGVWTRPQRMGDEGDEPSNEGDDEATAPPQDDGSDQGEEPHGGYPYYRPGEEGAYYGGYYGYPYAYFYPPYYYDYYPYPYYYSFYLPYYYPNRFFFGGSFGHGMRGPVRVQPRGSSGGSVRGSGGSRSSGARGTPRTSPRGHTHH